MESVSIVSTLKTSLVYLQIHLHHYEHNIEAARQHPWSVYNDETPFNKSIQNA